MKNCIKKHLCDDKRKDEIYEYNILLYAISFANQIYVADKKIFTADKKLLFYSN